MYHENHAISDSTYKTKMWRIDFRLHPSGWDSCKITNVVIGFHEIDPNVISFNMQSIVDWNQPKSLENSFHWLKQQVLEYGEVKNGSVLYMEGDYSTCILSFITNVTCRPFQHKMLTHARGERRPSTCRNMEWESPYIYTHTIIFMYSKHWTIHHSTIVNF